MVGAKLPLLVEMLIMIILPSTVTTIVKEASSSHSKDFKIGIKLNTIRNLHVYDLFFTPKDIQFSNQGVKKA
jgi:hypothetical protein